MNQFSPKRIPPVVLLVWLLLLLASTCQGQKLSEKERLQLTIDSLKAELEMCQNSGAYLFLKLAEREETYPKEEYYTYEEYRVTLLDQIQDNDSLYQVGVSVLGKVDSFALYVERLSQELIEESGGLDERGYPKNKRDKATVQRIMLGQGAGAELKRRITALEVKLQQRGGSGLDAERLLIDDTKLPETASSWEEFKFTGMPLVAVLPLLNQIKNNAQGAGITVLAWLGENRK